MRVDSPPVAVDLFAGAGGLSHGLLQAGWSVAIAVECERDMAATYRRNHPDTLVIESDITRIDFVQLRSSLKKGVDLLAGGPPCQGFSTVGKKDFFDPRNSLFGEFLRAADELSPSTILFENVSGFRGMYEGRIHSLLLEELTRRGYSAASHLIDAVDYGLPQFRKRTVVIGTRDERKVSLPPPTHTGVDHSLFGSVSPYLTVGDAISDLTPIVVGGESNEYLTPPRNEFQRRMRAGCTTLTEHTCANYGSRMREVLRTVPPGGSVLDLPEHLRPAGYFANTYARLWEDRPAPTITRNFGTPSSSRCIHPTENRAMSTREGARLQGFPDSYQFVGSKTSKNLQIGNAVPPILGEVLGAALLDAIGCERGDARYSISA